jgi:hypothetical protein
MPLQSRHLLPLVQEALMARHDPKTMTPDDELSVEELESPSRRRRSDWRHAD